jgi:hypothetical protein
VSAVQLEKGLLERLELGDLCSVLPDKRQVRSLQIVEIIHVTHMTLLTAADFESR